MPLVNKYPNSGLRINLLSATLTLSLSVSHTHKHRATWENESVCSHAGLKSLPYEKRKREEGTGKGWRGVGGGGGTSYAHDCDWAGGPRKLKTGIPTSRGRGK